MRSRCAALALVLHVVAIAIAIAIASRGSSAFSSLVFPKNHQHGARSALFANSMNIKAAMEATETYGVHSQQAKLAWEVVEEFDASTNDSAAFSTGAGGLSPEDLERAYRDVGASMELMRRNKYAAASFRDNQQLMQDVASELKAIKLSPPAKQPAPRIPGLWDSKLKARAITQQCGPSSREAQLAWEEVEEIASSGLENSIGGANVYGEESCDLITAAEACMALEELDRFLYQENYPAGDNLGDNDVVANTMSDYSMSDYKESYNQKFDQDYNQKFNNQNPNPDPPNPDQNYYDQSYDYNYNNNEDQNNNENYNSDNGGGEGTYH